MPGAPLVADVVRATVLSKAAVRVLHRAEPGHRAAHGGVLMRDAGRLERGQRRPGPVDVIHAPAPEPGAVLLLLGEQVVDGAAHVVLVPGLPGQKLDSVARHVDARRIDDGAEVEKRYVVEPGGIVVLLEGAPAAVPALHGRDPAACALHRSLSRAEVVEPDADDGCVVDVGIEVVVVLEGPAAGLSSGKTDGPVPAGAHFLRDEPLGGPRERGVVGWHARSAQGHDGETGVPDRRLTRFGPESIAVVDHEALPAVDTTAKVRRVGPLPAAGKRGEG